MKNPTDREAILYAYAIEANHDRSTLERYLKEYPEFAEELIDLSSELRLNEVLGGPPASAVPDPGKDAAWTDFIGHKPQQAAVVGAVNPLARFRGAGFASLATALKIPRSILTAVRDGLVTPSSVPKGFVRRLAAETGTPVDSVHAYLNRARQAPTELAFKADAKPSRQEQATFRDLIQSTEMTDEQRRFLLRECDEDELA